MQLAEAYVQIVPVAEGIGGGIASVLTPEAAAAGDEAGETAGTNLAMGQELQVHAQFVGLGRICLCPAGGCKNERIK